MKTTRIRRPGARLRSLIVDCLREQRAALAVAAMSLMGVVVADVLAPWPLKIIFDQILLGKALPPSLGALQPLLDLGTWPALLIAACAIALIALAGGVLAYVQLFTSSRVGHRITWRLRCELFSHLQRLSLAYHRDSRTGEMLTKVAGDTNLLREMYSDWALTLGRHAITLVAMLAVMFVLNWQLALVVSATLPPLLVVIFFLNRRVKASVRVQRRHEGQMVTRLNEVLSSIALVQAFGRHAYEEDRFRREIEANYQSGMRTARTTGAIVRAIAVISAAGTAVTVLLGAREVLAGRLTPGELLIFITYVTGLYKPVRDLSRLSAKFSRASVSAARVAEILDIEPDIEDAPDAIELRHPAGEIIFENVSFGYAPGRPVIESLNLRIAAGERVALVGPSGSGKSTLLNLLLRLYEPGSGRILIDGIDIRRYTRESLRREIGIVLQDNILFGVSVRENIAYGSPDASAEAIEAASRAARAHEFIVDLPQQYDTEIGERGALLSGGQRQRLCLARALVKSPAILVMDEPTASIDAASARLIHQAVARVHRGRTLIVIAHDYADMSQFDRVLVLKSGRLVEQGSHDTLMRSRGAYLALVERRHVP
jgi:ABC-type multidrug transport system fused ATPase/permease subunit